VFKSRVTAKLLSNITLILDLKKNQIKYKNRDKVLAKFFKVLYLEKFLIIKGGHFVYHLCLFTVGHKS